TRPEPGPPSAVPTTTHPTSALPGVEVPTAKEAPCRPASTEGTSTISGIEVMVQATSVTVRKILRSSRKGHPGGTRTSASAHSSKYSATCSMTPSTSPSRTVRSVGPTSTTVVGTSPEPNTVTSPSDSPERNRTSSAVANVYVPGKAAIPLPWTSHCGETVSTSPAATRTRSTWLLVTTSSPSRLFGSRISQPLSHPVSSR